MSKTKSAANDNGSPTWQEQRFSQSYPNAGTTEPPVPDPEAEEEPSQ